MFDQSNKPTRSENGALEKDARKGRRLSRRQILSGGAGAAMAAALMNTSYAQEAPEDPTGVMGEPASEVGARSPFVRPARMPTGEYPQGPCCSYTPHGDLEGMITPADLHFERHHNGVPTIDPEEHRLLIHGMVAQPMSFSLADLQRFPRVSRIHFLECSGNSGGHLSDPSEDDTAQTVAGLTSNSEWICIPLATLLREVGLSRDATWALFEANDGAVMTRSWPMDHLWDHGMLAIGQNGEPLRPEQGYPVRLLVAGTEGNANIKWLRRIEFSDRPWQHREETSKYTDVWCYDEQCDAYQFSFIMDAKSLITYPSGGQNVPGPGAVEIRGIAWSGRGSIDKVEVSTDGGNSWNLAKLEGPVLARAHTRFRYLWDWDGNESTIMSRAVDSTGYVQPSREELLEIRGEDSPTGYHSNQIFQWRVGSNGSVTSGHV